MSTRSLMIVAVDGSPETDSTMQHAVRIARQRAAALHAIQVIPHEGGLSIPTPKAMASPTSLRTLRTDAGHQGVRVRIVTLHGTPEHVIPAYAQLNAASLIVIARHYGSSRLWRNSAVARRLSRSAPVPVLVLPSRRDSATKRSLTHIVAAIDFTVASAIALRAAVELSRRDGARLTMLHAMNAPGRMVFSGGQAWRLVQELRGNAKSLAGRLKRKAIALGSRDAEAVVVTGDAHRGVLKAAAETGADLIVMGVGPRTWADELFSASTLRAVLRRATTPVLVVPLVAGAHAWIDETQEQAARTPGAVQALTRRAA